METDGTNETLPDTPATSIPPEVPGTPDSSSGGIDAGRTFIQDIVAEPPAPVPGLIEKLQAGNGAAGKPEGDGVSDAGNCPETIRVNPEDWKHLKDWKGRPFDPNIHKVNLDGSPAIGTKNRLQCLAKGETNPVKVLLSRFTGPDPEAVEIETQEEAHAQAQAVVDHGRIKRKARRVIKVWFAGGTTLFGLGFLKNRRERSTLLEEEMAEYMIETGKEIDVPPGLAAGIAFANDFEEFLYLNVGENPKEGAIKKLLLRRLPYIRWFLRKPKKKPSRETPLPEAETTETGAE